MGALRLLIRSAFSACIDKEGKAQNLSGETTSESEEALKEDFQDGCAMPAEEDAEEDVWHHLAVVAPDCKEPLPIADVRESWRTTGLHAMAALFVGAPMICLVGLPLFIWVWSWRKRHLVQNWTREIGFWFVTVLTVGSHAYYNYCAYEFLLGSTFNPGKALQQIATNTLVYAGYVVGILFYRILTVDMIQISAQVRYHKFVAAEKLRELDTKDRLGMLKMRFPTEYGFSPPPLKLHDVVIRNSRRLSGRRMAIVCILNVVTAAWLLHVRLSMHASGHRRPLRCLQIWRFYSDLFTEVKSFDNLVMFALDVTSVLLATTYWFRLIAQSLSTVTRLHQNTRQLLLFLALTTAHKIEELSPAHRSTLQGFLGDRSVETTSDLRSSLTELFGPEMMLNLASEADLKVWWALRQYIQVDFVDESVIMNDCAALVVILLFLFSWAGVLDWAVEKSPFGPELMLAVFMSAQLACVLGAAIQACVDMNSLMEMDQRVLLDVREEVCGMAKPEPTTYSDIGVIAEMLRVTQAKLSSYDDFQQIFGVKITAGVKTGWVLSTALACASSFFPWFGQELSHLDVNNLGKVFHMNVTGGEGSTAGAQNVTSP